MEFLLDYLFTNFFVLFAISGLFLVVITSRNLSKNDRIYFYVILSICFFISISSYYVYFILGFLKSDKAGTSAEKMAKYISYGGDAIVTTFYWINYCLRPSVALLFLSLVSHQRRGRSLFLWIPIVLCAAIYSSAYYSGVAFCVKDGVFYGGTIFFLRYFTHACSLGYLFLILCYSMKRFRQAPAVEKSILILCFVAIVGATHIEMFISDKRPLTATMILCALFYYIYLHLQLIRKNDEYLIGLSLLHPVTKMPNENSYLKAIDEIEKKVNEGHLQSYSVIVMDMNWLKKTNDTLGHRYGTALIMEVGQRLNAFFGQNKVFHVGGDEFISIIENIDLKELKSMISDFKKGFSNQEYLYEDKVLHVSVAIGAATYRPGDQFKNVFQRADDKMYLNKARIKNKYRVSKT